MFFLILASLNKYPSELNSYVIFVPYNERFCRSLNGYVILFYNISNLLAQNWMSLSPQNQGGQFVVYIIYWNV